MATSKDDFLVSTPPGISWTAPEKSRPWQNPPKLTDSSGVAAYYIQFVSSADNMDELLDTIETGIPLAQVAEGMMLGGVSTGLHTLDAGMLVMPVIIEMLQSLAMINDTDFVIFPDDFDKMNTTPDRAARLAVEAAFTPKGEKMQEPATTPESKAIGLMARKQLEVK
jgi:hypothetical protein